MPRSKQKREKLTKKEMKAIVKGDIDNNKVGTARRLTKKTRIAILRDYYMGGMGYTAISKKWGVADNSVRWIVVESRELAEIKRELKAKARQQAEELSNAYAKQALETVGDAKGLQAATAWGIAQTKIKEQEEKEPEGRGVRITYSAWDKASTYLKEK